MDGSLDPVIDDVPGSSLLSLPPKKPRGGGTGDLDEPAEARAGQTLAQGYVIQRLVAKGAMGRIYLATQTPPGREVAVKCIQPLPNDEGFRKRFALEAATSARLAHRHIVTVHDYGETDSGELFLTMEYLRGDALSRLLTREGRLSSERTAKIGLQICRALRFAHSKGVLHRDLTPANVMLLRDEDNDAADFIKVLDFGLVKAYQKGGQDTGTWTGSPRYMAPEQIRRKDVDARTDIYSLGAILFHLLAGRPPFGGATSVEIFSQHLRDPVPWIRDVTGLTDVAAELEVVVRRCLEKDASKRYQVMDDLMADMKAALRLIEGTTGLGDPVASGFDSSEISLPGTALPAVQRARSSALSLDELAAEAGVLEGGSGLPSAELEGPRTSAPIELVQVVGSTPVPGTAVPASLLAAPAPAAPPAHRDSEPFAPIADGELWPSGDNLDDTVVNESPSIEELQRQFMHQAPAPAVPVPVPAPVPAPVAVAPPKAAVPSEPVAVVPAAARAPIDEALAAFTAEEDPPLPARALRARQPEPVDDTPIDPPKGAPWGAILIALIIAAGVGFFLFGRDGDGEVHPAVPSKSPPASGDPKVSITSTPPGAEVWLDGKLVGTSPLEYAGAGKAVGTKLTFTFKLAGHQDSELAVDLAAEPAKLAATLDKKPVSPAASPSATPRRTAAAASSPPPSERVPDSVIPSPADNATPSPSASPDGKPAERPVATEEPKPENP